MPKIQDTSGTDRIVVRQGPRHSTLWLAAAAVVVLVGIVLVFPSIRRWAQTERSFERDRLRFAQVTRGALVSDLAVDGRIVASSYPTLYSPASGTIQLDVRVGDQVRRDQLLARIDSPVLDSRITQESSSVEALQAQLSSQRVTNQATNLRNQQDVDLGKLKHETAQREMNRSEQMHSEGLINQIEYEKAKDDLRIAQLEYEHAVASARLDEQTLDYEVRDTEKQLERQQLVLEEARRRVRELEIRSPVDGVVGSLSVNPEDTVVPNQELLTVIDLSAFEIEIRIPENYADEIKIGNTAEITYEGRKHRGSVSSVSPEVTGSLVEGRVVFGEDLPAGLKQNQRVSTRIILSSRDDVLKVRRGPFLESGGGRKVYVEQDGTATLREIVVGSTSLTEVEIISGLSEGETIVISDTARFGDAEAILLRN